MKRMNTLPTYLAIVAIFFSVFLTKAVYAQPYGEVSFDLFYDELSPYGDWDRDANYGDIWFPHVDRNFRPYGTNGYWTMTEYGNTWVSNYDWGWAPFHYGRWVYTNYNGWGWIPDYEWGPAWVDWRTGGGYYGWAPMAPRSRVQVAVAMPLNLWVFLPVRRIYDPYISRHWSYGQRSIYNRTTIINNTYVVNNHHYYGGPGRRDIERNIGRRVNVREIRTIDRPGRSRVDSRSVSLYRPDRNTVRSSSNNTSRANTGMANRSTVNSSRNERSAGNSRNTSRSAATTNESRTSRGNVGTAPTTPRSNTRTTTAGRATQTESRASRDAGRSAANNTGLQNGGRSSSATVRGGRAENSSRTPAQGPSRSSATERPQAAPQQRSAPNRSESRAPQRQSAPVQQASQRSSTSNAQASRSASSRTERSSAGGSSRASKSSNSERSSGRSTR
ncbi:DUF6600 domain-containing protein [Sphingobacterium griseoflavum]|uniref:Prolin-rich transmembrane protein n=1 Tax=Sphingobacterium griseoflavum TaxID=1474952 RepID=A0ABQ3HTF6_9SPHI|nr:DUF6600 domain-containing protein [Sphingobacterium griseoflavum]GHE23467.1 hypothetical protein GCM10017764_04350 [Sphingobacterium griseoflavum]